MAKFDTFAVGEINECFERFVFHNRNQQHSETSEQFLTTVRVLIKSCNVCDACRNSTLRDRIVLGVYDRDVQEALLKQHNISLETTIDTCRAAEHARSHSKVIRPEAVNKVGKSRYVESNKGSFDNYPSANTKWRRNQQVQTSVQNRQQKLPNGTPCQQCGFKSHADGICPANGETCNFCGKPNLFEKVCRRKKRENKHVRQVEPDSRTQHPLGDSSEDEYARAMHNLPTNKTTARKSPLTVIAVNNINAKVMIDTGASVNVTNERRHTTKRSGGVLRNASVKVRHSMSSVPRDKRRSWLFGRFKRSSGAAREHCQNKRALKVKGVVPENERHGGDGSTSLFRLPMHVQR